MMDARLAKQIEEAALISGVKVEASLMIQGVLFSLPLRFVFHYRETAEKTLRQRNVLLAFVSKPGLCLWN